VNAFIVLQSSRNLRIPGLACELRGGQTFRALLADPWAGHVARVGRRGTRIGCWLKSQKLRGHWEDQDVGGWIILRWMHFLRSGLFPSGFLSIKPYTVFFYPFALHNPAHLIIFRSIILIIID
jgi:hypothetical protein